ncbi:unnamed protein product [Schistosoma curassoni]|uniref:Uncharacterized protein n=1 Tax=Schistosoma curassoni TaxID=6186 RepID=A0A183KM37_9TREM|nr:unnamed protein product [Schistosoma curassoni]
MVVVDQHAISLLLSGYNVITAISGITVCAPDSHRYSMPLSLWLCKACCSANSLLILEAIELLNLATKSPSDKQAAVDDQSSAFHEIERVITSAALDLNETMKVDLNKETDKHMDVGIVARRKKKRAEKEKLLVDCTEACESASPGQTIGEPGLYNVEEVIKRQNKVNEWFTVTPSKRKPRKQNVTSALGAELKSDGKEEMVSGTKIP